MSQVLFFKCFVMPLNHNIYRRIESQYLLHRKIAIILNRSICQFLPLVYTDNYTEKDFEFSTFASRLLYKIEQSDVANQKQ